MHLQLHELVVEHNVCFSIKDGGVGIADKVCRDNLGGRISEEACIKHLLCARPWEDSWSFESEKIVSNILAFLKCTC